MPVFCGQGTLWILQKILWYSFLWNMNLSQLENWCNVTIFRVKRACRWHYFCSQKLMIWRLFSFSPFLCLQILNQTNLMYCLYGMLIQNYDISIFGLFSVTAEHYYCIEIDFHFIHPVIHTQLLLFKKIWNCRLQNINHYVSVPMC